MDFGPEPGSRIALRWVHAARAAGSEWANSDLRLTIDMGFAAPSLTFMLTLLAELVSVGVVAVLLADDSLIGEEVFLAHGFVEGTYMLALLGDVVSGVFTLAGGFVKNPIVLDAALVSVDYAFRPFAGSCPPVAA